MQNKINTPAVYLRYLGKGVQFYDQIHSINFQIINELSTEFLISLKKRSCVVSGNKVNVSKSRLLIERTKFAPHIIVLAGVRYDEGKCQVIWRVCFQVLSQSVTHCFLEASSFSKTALPHTLHTDAAEQWLLPTDPSTSLGTTAIRPMVHIKEEEK